MAETFASRMFDILTEAAGHEDDWMPLDKKALWLTEEADAEITRLTRELSEAREALVQTHVESAELDGSVIGAQSPWQPIATAPSEMEPILTYDPRNIQPVSIRKSDGAWWRMEKCGPTHWMPLPPSPDDRTNERVEQSGSLKQTLPESSSPVTGHTEETT